MALICVSFSLFRHGEYQICICSSERHNLTVESERVQLSVMERQTEDCVSVGHLVSCESVLHP